MSSVYWVDIISDIVDRVRSDSDNPCTGDAPYYMYGHPLDVIGQLQMKDKNDNFKYKKYPVIILLQDYDETYGDSQVVKSEVTGLNVIIATNTSPDYISSERYTNNFKPTLQPLYELFVEHLVSSKQFLEIAPGAVPHTKTDRLYWGRSGLYGNDANIFNDYIDAIEITDLNLKLSKIKYC